MCRRNLGRETLKTNLFVKIRKLGSKNIYLKENQLFEMRRYRLQTIKKLSKRYLFQEVVENSLITLRITVKVNR
jgi:hypothetical protein